MRFNLAKMHNSGNSFIVCFAKQFKLTKTEIASLCNPRTGVGGDGFILIENGATAKEYKLGFFNNNGSRFKMCFNGTLCAALFLRKYKELDDNIFLNITDFGLISVEFDKEIVALTFKIHDIQIISKEVKSPVAKGVCHYVFLTDNHKVILTDCKFFHSDSFIPKAKELRAKDKLFSQGANVHFACVYKNKVFMRHFEKGIEDETLSCGSGCVATALVLSERKKIEFISRGGNLIIVKKTNDTWTMSSSPKFISWLILEVIVDCFKPN